MWATAGRARVLERIERLRRLKGKSASRLRLSLRGMPQRQSAGCSGHGRPYLLLKQVEKAKRIRIRAGLLTVAPLALHPIVIDLRQFSRKDRLIRMALASIACWNGCQDISDFPLLSARGVIG